MRCTSFSRRWKPKTQLLSSLSLTNSFLSMRKIQVQLPQLKTKSEGIHSKIQGSSISLKRKRRRAEATTNWSSLKSWQVIYRERWKSWSSKGTLWVSLSRNMFGTKALSQRKSKCQMITEACTCKKMITCSGQCMPILSWMRGFITGRL
jgi:hypothetical protein